MSGSADNDNGEAKSLSSLAGTVRHYNTVMEFGANELEYREDDRQRDDFNREVIVGALQFVVDKAAQGDEAAAQLLKNYSVKSANLDYDNMPLQVASEVIFRDQLIDKIKVSALKLTDFVAYVGRYAFNTVVKDAGPMKDAAFLTELDRARAALGQLNVPDVDAGAMRFYIDNGYSWDLDWEGQEERSGSVQ